MSSIVEFALLGLAIGGLYSLFAVGLVVIHRGSGVVNFAHGAVGMVGTFVFWWLHGHGWPYGLAGLAGILASALIGLIVHTLIMRPLRRHALVTRVIATLAVLTILQEVVARLYTGPPIVVESALPTKPIDILGARVGADRIIIIAIVLVIVGVAELVYRRTQFGRATSAAAENPRALAALGWSPDLVAGANWMIGCGLAGVAGILLAPTTNLSVTFYTLLVVPALAAAVTGRLNSMSLAVLGAMVIGVAQSEVSRFWSVPGLSDAIPFLLVIVLLILRGPDRTSRVAQAVRLPSVGTGLVRPAYVIVVAAGSILLIQAMDAGWQDAMTTTVGTALIVLSVVVTTGYTGQLSLAQLGFAGFGAWVSAGLASHHGVSFPMAVVLGVGASIPLGIVVGAVCLRTRGVNLAIATLGMAVALNSMIFSNPDRTDFGYFTVPSPRLGSLDIGAIIYPDRYAIFTIVLFTLCALAVANLRRGRGGRRMVAVRSNERAAASLGISVVQAKLFAFALSSGVAALGGILLAFRNPTVLFDTYDASGSIKVVEFAIVGGVGWIAGALYGATLEIGSIGSKIFDLFGSGVSSYLPLVGAVMVILLLISAPDGLAAHGKMQVDWVAKQVRRLVRRRTEPDIAAPAAAAPRAVTPLRLQVKDVTVTFGGVVALDQVSVTVDPGEVVGLIGPNGAGKTTFIDAATGSVRPRAGSVLIGDKDITRSTTSTRARNGLGRSFQSLELFDDLTVLDNLRAASEPRDAKAFLSDLAWPRTLKLTGVTESVIEEFGLRPYLEMRPTDLPYGTRRLVGIARALASGASVVALDEPAAGLDDEEAHELGRLLRRLTTEWQMSVLLVEHNVELVMRVSDRIYALDFGKIIAHGTPQEIRDDPAVIEAYLGVGAAEENAALF